MIPTLLASGLIIYGFFQATVAFTAVVLSVKWNKYEFLAGLSFLLIYAILYLFDTFFFTILYGVFLDIAQFGFILLAIVFFIIGMHPKWAPKMASDMRQRYTGHKFRRDESLISILKKL
ncbi:MAG: hypothetical protein LUQ04_09990 [Methanoregula sp.]|nr:hypothetical protein [Methanoregula sp.]